MPDNLRGRLVAALQSGSLRAPFTRAGLLRAIGEAAGDGVLAELEQLSGMGLDGEALATWIDTSSAAFRAAPRPELVWTGPPVPGLHARDTDDVFEELLGTASKSIWASTYAFYDGRKAFQTLSRRMDEVPDLKVTMLMNIQRPRGDERHAKVIVAEFRERFWTRGWPGERRPRVFYDARSLSDDPEERGVLHAKAIVKDESVALVTSANFTEAALVRNLELGLISRDKAVARSIVLHFRRLIEVEALDAL